MVIHDTLRTFFKAYARLNGINGGAAAPRVNSKILEDRQIIEVIGFKSNQGFRLDLSLYHQFGSTNDILVIRIIKIFNVTELIINSDAKEDSSLFYTLHVNLDNRIDFDQIVSKPNDSLVTIIFPFRDAKDNNTLNNR